MKKISSLIVAFTIIFLSMTSVGAKNKDLILVDDDGAECPNAIYTTIEEAVNSATDGDVIHVCTGEYDGVELDKSVEIRGNGHAVIVGGPSHSSGLSQGFRLVTGSDGSSLNHLYFDEVDLAIMNGGAVDDIEVNHNYFYSPIQAVSNWMGSGWNIHHNDIENLRTRNGGGIGIMLADFMGGVVENNNVSHNNIFGTLTQAASEQGGYNGSGIVLYADFRWNREGTDKIKNNTVVHNKVSIEDQASSVNMVAFELTEARDLPIGWEPLIFDNTIKFNDFLGTDIEFAFSPYELNLVNDYSRNKGTTSGHTRGVNNTPFGP